MAIQTILELVIAIASLIIIHELGHFIAARIFKIEVEEFGIGYPPRILTLFTAGGTKFTLNWIPLGGFIRPKGDNDPSVPGGLAAASPWKRIGLLVAGPLMNLLVAVFLYALIYTQIGVPDPARLNVVEITMVEPASPSAIAGLQVGDIIVKANDQVVDGPDKLHQIVDENLDKPMKLEIQRGDQISQVTLTPRSNPPANQGPIGIVMGTPTVALNPLQALPVGALATANHSIALLTMIGQLIRGTAAPQEGRLIGYKGMYDMYQSIRQGSFPGAYPPFVEELAFFTNVTISLGLLNLLPIPALDGGRVMFVLPEIVLRRRIPPRYENWINAVSLMLLVLLLIFINLQDFINPIQFPK